MRKAKFTESQIVEISVNDLKRMGELEAENAKLKRMYADLAPQSGNHPSNVESPPKARINSP